MMELPESCTLAKQIGQVLTGKVIREIIVLKTTHRFAFFKNDISTYPELLEGQTVTGAAFKGGMLEIDTEDTMIVFSDGVTPGITRMEKNGRRITCSRCCLRTIPR